MLNYLKVEMNEDHQLLYDVTNSLNLIMMEDEEEEEEVVEVEVEQMVDYRLFLFHLLLNHFLFQLNLMLNEDMDRHDAKIEKKFLHFQIE
jgi:hypothetical protein